MDPFETFEHAGFTCEIGMEEDSSSADPRDWDNLGTMVCWHPDYTLGDLQFLNSDGRGAVKRNRHGSASTLLQSEHGRADFPSMETVERYLRLAHKAVVILPLYLLDHSGLHLSAGSNTVGRGDTAAHADAAGTRDATGTTSARRAATERAYRPSSGRRRRCATARKFVRGLPTDEAAAKSRHPCALPPGCL